MKTDPHVKKILNLTKALYNELVKAESQSLTKTEVLEIIGTNYEYLYSYIVSALAYIKKIVKKAGRTGGIEVNRKQGLIQEIAVANENDLIRFFKKLDISLVPSTQIKKKPKENTFYSPLQEYLEQSGLFDIVETRADSRKGKKWENVDLVGIAISALNYHIGIFPKLTGIEVKSNFPTILDIQQAASYLRYCNASYLCFYDQNFNGKNTDELMTRLRDDGIWEMTNTFNIGLIISYTYQQKSKNYNFQIIKEAPEMILEPNIIDEGIDLLLSSKSKKNLKENLKEEVLKIIGH